MREVMAGILEISEDDISVKATTTEKLGLSEGKKVLWPGRSIA